MTGRSHSMENNKKQPVSPTPAQGMFQPRPFVVQPQTEERSEQPDIKTALQRAERYGHRLDRIKSIKPPVQAKLTIGQPGDRYEQEADRVAAQVVNQIHAPTTQRQEMPDEELQAKPEITALQRQKEPDEEIQAKPSISDKQRSPLFPEVQREAMPEEDEELQTKSNLQGQEAIGGGEASTDVESAINSARGGGQPLDAGLQQSMGQAMGADFSGVKVHTDATTDQLNQSIQAKAFTTGQDVFFRQGAYEPGSREGQELIAHELTHVVQQNGGAVMRSQSQGTEQSPPTVMTFAGDRLIREKGDSSTTSLLSAQSISPAPSIIQRKLKIGDIEYSNPKTIRKRARKQGVDEKIFDTLVALGKADTLYTFSDWQKASAAATHAKQRETWWNSEETEGIWNLNPEDPLFQDIARECLTNHDENPYSTDALHETGPIMQGWMNSKGFLETMWNVVPALFAKKTILGKNVDDRPDLEITRIQMIKNKKFLDDYKKAKEEIEEKNSGDANERSLYSGHSVQGMDYITQHGHAPDYGTYDRSAKGHGAHGRGAYFTDRVDKAVSYSSKDQQTEERSFFKQDVLLGKVHDYTERGKYRHRHHNEMVRSKRNQRNKARVEGIAGTGLEDYDSLQGQKTYEPGAGIFGTIRHQNQFDSNEYMVRNADQIYVKFRIFYKLRSDRL